MIASATLAPSETVLRRLDGAAALPEPRETGLAEDLIEVAVTMEELAPIVNVIPLQRLAYELAVLRSICPDDSQDIARTPRWSNRVPLEQRTLNEDQG